MSAAGSGHNQRLYREPSGSGGSDPSGRIPVEQPTRYKLDTNLKNRPFAEPDHSAHAARPRG
jgi:hypothetical protein